MYLNILNRINIFDNYILYAIKKYLKNRYLDRLMPIVTVMGNLGIVWIIVAVTLMLDKPYKRIGGIVILTLIISTIIGEGIVKHIVRRVRPCNDKSNINLLISKPISYSFPSGHTSSSFAVAWVLSMYFSEYKIIFMTMAFLIALSRLYLYVHYPTDVIGGIIIGIICSKLVFIILNEVSIQNIYRIYKNILMRG
ncbi:MULTISPECIES: phosphatase PAP2 family protein [Clostridium]|jgi:undecaprenyl-diphosphatase|uniref:phosphatase PAP2 family protein n=1 Tax=Clostridium TaxID=1485 RepID=UPI0002895F70|nr:MULTISPECIES: phosphatase PAP2 family protein [Clostridium]MDF2503131.1 rane-associated phospholipid phosphatase [Clostridium sp.]